MMIGLQQFGRDVWALVKGYWGSEERWSASVLLTAIIGLDLGYVYINVLLNKANGNVFNALQQYDTASFYRGFGAILALVLILLAATLVRVFLLQTLQLRWRRWLTNRYLTLARRPHLLSLVFPGGSTTRTSASPRTSASSSTTPCLWARPAEHAGNDRFLLCDPLAPGRQYHAPIGGLELTIPGYMFWVAVLYSGVGSVLAHLVGHPLIRLNNLQRSVEADFRFSLVRLREEAEGIALYRGEAQERGIALGVSRRSTTTSSASSCTTAST